MKINSLRQGIRLLLITTMSAQSVHAQDFNFLTNKSVDLRPQIQQFGMAVRDQYPRGTCTIFATTFLIEYWTAREKGLKNTDFSEEYIAAAARRASDDKSDNYFFSEAAQGYEEYGIVDEADAPYQMAGQFKTSYLQDDSPATLALLEKGKKNRFLDAEIIEAPNKPGLSDPQIVRILTELDRRNPVAVGFGGSADTKYTKIGKPVLAMNDCSGSLNYAHTVPLVGYTIDPTVPGGGYAIYRDSGGPNAGDAGYRYMTFNYLKKFVYDVLIFSKTPVRFVKGDLNLIQKRFLTRKDILKTLTARRQQVRLPFISAAQLKTQVIAERQ